MVWVWERTTPETTSSRLIAPSRLGRITTLLASLRIGKARRTSIFPLHLWELLGTPTTFRLVRTTASSTPRHDHGSRRRLRDVGAPAAGAFHIQPVANVCAASTPVKKLTIEESAAGSASASVSVSASASASAAASVSAAAKTLWLHSSSHGLTPGRPVESTVRITSSTAKSTGKGTIHFIRSIFGRWLIPRTVESASRLSDVQSSAWLALQPVETVVRFT